MPGSSEKGKLAISQWFNSLPTPRSVLDVGPGWGTYSKLLRREGQTWHCVEVHEPYVERFGLPSLYDRVFTVDIREFVPPRHYDVAICGDILEHISTSDAIDVLRSLLSACSYVLISLPIDAETGAELGTCDVYWGNPNEMHQGRWCNRDFIKTACELGGEILALEKYEELAVYLISSRQSDYIPETITSPREWFLRRFSQKYANQLDERTVLSRLESRARSSVRRVLPARLRRAIKTVVRRKRWLPLRGCVLTPHRPPDTARPMPHPPAWLRLRHRGKRRC